MGWKEVAEPVLTRMPSVQQPEGHVPFRRKLTWTAGVLVLYFFLTNVQIWGLPAGPEEADLFGQFRSILAGSQFSVLHLGIGPIVTASIVLQLLGGANLLGLDTDDPRDQVLYQGLQKLLVVVMIFLTGLPMVLSGFLPPDTGPNSLAQQVGGVANLQAIMFAQIFVGGVLILFMDEIISKWGVGSGIGLFIIAGVSQSLVGGIIGPDGLVANWIGIATGEIGIGPVIGGRGIQQLLLSPGGVLGVFTTVLIFVVVVYAESVRVEIPLSHARVKGARGRFPVKLIYASVLPMILVRALQANVQFAGRLLRRQLGDENMPDWLGVYQNVSQASGGTSLQPTEGFFYYTAPIYSRQDWMWFVPGFSTQEPLQILTRVGVDLTFMIIGGAIFAVFWVETTDMGPKATAKQIHNSGMQIPGFRQNPGVIEKVMERYIPQVTIIGGALVGLLAVMANMLGTIGQVSGTGLLLTVSITYKIYEEIAEEQLMEMHPVMRQMFG